MVGAVFIALGFQLVIWQLRTLSDNARQADNRAAAQALYTTQLTAYSTAVANYVVCTEVVATSNLNRLQWEQLADIVSNLENGIPYADLIRGGPLLDTPARTVEDCPPPGDAPVAPGG